MAASMAKAMMLQPYQVACMQLLVLWLQCFAFLIMINRHHFNQAILSFKVGNCECAFLLLALRRGIYNSSQAHASISGCGMHLTRAQLL